MLKETAWQQMDDWYWAGPDGWTICKVWSGGSFQYELWRPGGQGAEGRFPSLKAAQAGHGKAKAA